MQNQLVRLLSVPTASVTTLAGVALTSGRTDGLGTAATFYFPEGVGMDAAGTNALVVDRFNHAVRRVNVATGSVSTVAGRPGVSGFSDGVGTVALFSYPFVPGVNAAGTVALVADQTNQLVRRIDLTTGAVTSIAGQPGVNGFADGVGPQATMSGPEGLALDPNGTLALVTDANNNAIRLLRFGPAPPASTTTATASSTSSASRAAQSPSSSPAPSSSPTPSSTARPTSTVMNATVIAPGTIVLNCSIPGVIARTLIRDCILRALAHEFKLLNPSPLCSDL